MVYFWKIRPQQFLIKQLLDNGDQWSLADRRIKQRVQFRSQKTRKNGGNHPAGNVTIDFFIWGVTYLLKSRSYMYKTDGWDRSAVVTHHPQSNCQMRNRQSLLFTTLLTVWYITMKRADFSTIYLIEIRWNYDKTFIFDEVTDKNLLTTRLRVGFQTNENNTEKTR